MIQHYSKVALRNLMKYKTQNLISTIGLAVGLLVNGNLAVSNIRKLECSSFDFHSIAYGYGKFKEKIHFTEYYP